jgi:hypothetical protein
VTEFNRTLFETGMNELMEEIKPILPECDRIAIEARVREVMSDCTGINLRRKFKEKES